jgi:hypothetical protein
MMLRSLYHRRAFSAISPRAFGAISPRAFGAISIGSTLLLAGCAGMGLGALADVALNAARKTFLGVATENYGEGYRDDFDKLLTTLTKKEDAAAAAAAQAQTDSAAAAQAAAAPVYVPPPTPLELEVAVLREEIRDGRQIPVPVADGDVVHDRFGTHGLGDNLKINFRTNVDCYVYVIGIDGTGWAQPIFPSEYAGYINPVKPSTMYTFPEGNIWIPLDSYRGVEHLYFLASRTPRPDLERALVEIAAHVRPEDSQRAPGERPLLAQVESDAPIARGFDKARVSSFADVQSSNGQDHTVPAQAFFASKADGDVLVTRWFRHE